MEKEHLMSSKEKTLENWMKEFFPYADLKKAGIFTKEMKGDYEAQAKKICDWFGYESIYEYGKDEIKIHISKPESKRKKDDQFLTVIPSIWDK